MKMRQRTWNKSLSILAVMIVVVLSLSTPPTEARRARGNCGLTCYRWRKCKANLNVLSDTGGRQRPGQSGTTGQLFFQKCGDPPAGCECTLETTTTTTTTTEAPKPDLPKLDKLFMEYVDPEAQQWLETVMEVF